MLLDAVPAVLLEIAEITVLPQDIVAPLAGLLGVIDVVTEWHCVGEGIVGTADNWLEQPSSAPAVSPV